MHDSLLYVVIILAVVFDFINGFHDTANAIATVISTRVLTPAVAILMSASLNFLGALSGTAVAKTIGSGIVGTNVLTEVVVAALIGAIIWNLVTWYYGIPSSSSHSLIGGLIGGVVAASGFSQIHSAVLLQKVLLPFFASPLIGFFGGIFLMNFIARLFAQSKPASANTFFRRIQVVSSAFMAFSHGSNDAQKTMGIITLALISAGKIPSTPFVVPLWVVGLSATAMAIGTAGGGWKIIKTMGTRLVTLTPVHGFAAETAAATVIETASRFGFPLSTTHIISSSILGVGASRRLKAVRWNIATNIVRAWIFTIPITALIAFTVYKVSLLFR